MRRQENRKHVMRPAQLCLGHPRDNWIYIVTHYSFGINKESGMLSLVLQGDLGLAYGGSWVSGEPKNSNTEKIHNCFAQLTTRRMPKSQVTWLGLFRSGLLFI